MTIEINQTEGTEPIKVRRRNQGEDYEQTNVSLPKKLKEKINIIVLRTGHSRSKLITELLTEALDARERS